MILSFIFFNQANLVAAFEQSLQLMTTRLQSLSISQEQKVSSHPHFQTQTLTNLNSSCIPPLWPSYYEHSAKSRQRCASIEWGDFDHSLRWGAEFRLEAQAAVPHGDLVREEDQWKTTFTLSCMKSAISLHVHSHQTSHSCILQPLYLFCCE